MSKKNFTLTYPRNRPLTSLLGQWRRRSPPTHLAARYYLKELQFLWAIYTKKLFMWLWDQEFLFRRPALKNPLPFPLLEDLNGLTSSSMVKATRRNFPRRMNGLVLSAEAISKELGATCYRNIERMSKTGRLFKTIATILLCWRRKKLSGRRMPRGSVTLKGKKRSDKLWRR